MVPTIIFSVLDPGAAGDRRIAVSRAGLLARAAVVGGGVVAGGIAITGFPGIALGSPSPEQDAQVLDLLLQLEYVQAAFYEDANKRGSLKGELAEFSRIVGGHEDEHVAFLKNALGSKASPKPRVDFGARHEMRRHSPRQRSRSRIWALRHTTGRRRTSHARRSPQRRRSFPSRRATQPGSATSPGSCRRSRRRTQPRPRRSYATDWAPPAT